MENAYLVCEGKKVAGAYDTLPDQYRQIDVLDMGGKFVIPGTCDIHVHASQASFQGIGQNIENGQWNTWFDRYAFPDESRFNDITYAEQAYTRFAKSLLATPTTRLCLCNDQPRSDRDSHESPGKIRICRLCRKSEYGPEFFAGSAGNDTGDDRADPPLAGRDKRTELVRFIRFSRRDIFPSCTESTCSSWDSLQKNTISRCSRTFQRGWMKLTGCGSLHRILTFSHRPMTAGLLGSQTQAMAAILIPGRGGNTEKAQCAGSALSAVRHEQLRLRGADGLSGRWDQVGLGTDVGGGNTEYVRTGDFGFQRSFGLPKTVREIWTSGKLSLPNAFYLATKAAFSGKAEAFEPGYCFIW